jgi:hypothetical protein
MKDDRPMQSAAPSIFDIGLRGLISRETECIQRGDERRLHTRKMEEMGIVSLGEKGTIHVWLRDSPSHGAYDLSG